MDVYVSRVRGKLAEALPNTETIHTHPGIGYRFCHEGSVQRDPGASGSRSCHFSPTLAGGPEAAPQ